LNFLPFWTRDVEVWGNRMTATSLDRLANLYLHHLGLRGTEEKWFLEQHVRPGMHVADIGANQGLYTLLISDIVGSEGSVHAFEPDACLFASLRKNCEANRASNVALHNVALGRVPGEMKMYRSRVNSGDNRLAKSRHSNWFEEVQVRVAPLDSILEGRHIDFIKIDVQGWEHQVFLGMERLLRDNPAVRIYFEYWPLGLANAGCPPLDCLRHLTSQGFTLYHAAGGSPAPLLDFVGLTQSLQGQHCANLLAMREKPEVKK
jgi:FkbM family methyltransferase